MPVLGSSAPGVSSANAGCRHSLGERPSDVLSCLRRTRIGRLNSVSCCPTCTAAARRGWPSSMCGTGSSRSLKRSIATRAHACTTRY
ncbi:hypothetical protein BDV95DRAFT_580825 [Massariosphaeria phaeospora]|uniref:Uncharacterized protein n=1 Tax=Massariosphaeria phaeospora TaxID=100035 RepID=A0A7C8MF35_9PLEO|nr:hypothetical protein BDV95DRAFT_580825 [Massariosphaeria phaeospora]